MRTYNGLTMWSLQDLRNLEMHNLPLPRLGPPKGQTMKKLTPKHPDVENLHREPHQPKMGTRTYPATVGLVPKEKKDAPKKG